MKAYGMNVKEYENDSKKIGDLIGGRRPSTRILQKNALRRYKKVARRIAIEIEV
jgi:hypothetical protein